MSADGDDGIDVHEDMLGCLDGLYGYAMALTHDPTEAEDLVQETYMRAALRLSPGRRG